MDPNELSSMQQYVADAGITPSALRNLGEPGFVGVAKQFLGKLELLPLATIELDHYSSWLDSRTSDLMNRFPKPLWGPARKSMNIFMVMAALNRFVCAAYRLERLETVLEVPLDNYVAKALLEWAKEKKLLREQAPKWVSIKELDEENSSKLQGLAMARADELRIPRGRLDVAL
jgi:hypothetical protein